LKILTYTSILAIILASGAALAQGGGGGGFAGGGAARTRVAPLMVYTAKGLVILNAAVLGKFDAMTLEKQATLELFGPMPAVPDRNADNATVQAYRNEQNKRQDTPALLTGENGLLVVIGDMFFRVDVADLTIKATGSFAPVPPPAAVIDGAVAVPAIPTIRQPNMQGVTPLLQLEGTTLFILRGTTLTALNTDDGKVISQLTLPQEMVTPTANPAGGLLGGLFGRGGGGGGAAGGGAIGGAGGAGGGAAGAIVGG
jgi:hypothetical protein